MVERLLVVFDSIINLIDDLPKRIQNQPLTHLFSIKKQKKLHYFFTTQKECVIT